MNLKQDATLTVQRGYLNRFGAIHKGRPHGGGEGGSRIAQFCGQIVVIGCVKCGQGGGGVDNPKNYADVICGP